MVSENLVSPYNLEKIEKNAIDSYVKGKMGFLIADEPILSKKLSISACILYFTFGDTW